MWKKLIYSIFVFLSPKFSDFYVFIFRIIFARTNYDATVQGTRFYRVWVPLVIYHFYDGLRIYGMEDSSMDGMIPIHRYESLDGHFQKSSSS